MEHPTDVLELSSLGESLKNTNYQCPNDGLWIPIFKNDSEIWLDSNETPIHFTYWNKGQPNGGPYFEKCAYARFSHAGEMTYRDTKCANQNCFYCKIPDFFDFHMRGLCKMKESIRIDKKYVIRPNMLVNGRPMWKGYTSNQIYWNKTDGNWVLFNTVFDQIIATTSNTIFPIGVNVWVLRSPDICDGHYEDREISLKFSKCNQFEYSCSDGACISIELKCNFVPDCWNGDDAVL